GRQADEIGLCAMVAQNNGGIDALSAVIRPFQMDAVGGRERKRGETCADVQARVHAYAADHPFVPLPFVRCIAKEAHHMKKVYRFQCRVSIHDGFVMIISFFRPPAVEKRTAGLWKTCLFPAHFFHRSEKKPRNPAFLVEKSVDKVENCNSMLFLTQFVRAPAKTPCPALRPMFLHRNFVRFAGREGGGKGRMLIVTEL
ncbi:MAG: hypothetical protein IJ174_02940, partial [Clostridia bacterium]|nr:hypothetical protein [Clostridia bacterium]